MKKQILFYLMLISASFSFGQGKSNVIVFSETSEPFYLSLNGAMQNGTPETKVKVTDIDEGSYVIKITFKNTTLKNISKNVLFEAGKQYTLRVKQNRKGEYVLRYFGEVAINEATDNGSSEYGYSKESVELGSTGSTSTTSTTSGTSNTSGTTTTTSETVTTETTVGGTSTSTNVDTQSGENSESVSMDVNMGGVSMDVDMNVNGTGSTSESSTTTTTTTTTTTSSGNMDAETSVDGSSGSNTTNGSDCYTPESDISSMKSALENETFEDDKLALAKRIVKKKCLKAEQVKELAQLFTFEENMLEFAKYAYDYTYDQDNYYLINEVFTFSSSKEELNEYIESK